MILNSNGSMLFCGDAAGQVIVYNAWNLQKTSQKLEFEEHGAITSMVLQSGLS